MNLDSSAELSSLLPCPESKEFAQLAEQIRQPLSRRQALRLGAGALLSLGLWPGRSEEAADQGSWFRFLVVNDLHYMTPECGAWLAKIVDRMRGHAGVEFLLVVGDLTEHGHEEHLAAVKEVLGQLKLPVYVLPGNHDYISQNDRTGYDKVFPNSLNYTFEHRGWQFVGLDTTEGLKYQQTQVQPTTLDWLDKELPRLTPSRPTVVFTHFPMGAGIIYRPLNADALLERFLEFNLQAVYCGHFHAYTLRQLRNAWVTTNKCCALKRANHDASPEKGYFLCTVDRGKLSRLFVRVN